MSVDGGLPPGCTDAALEFEMHGENDMPDEIDSDVEQAQATAALVLRLKQEGAALAADNAHLRELWTARSAELDARAREIDALTHENRALRGELNSRVRTAQEALSGLLELGNQYRPTRSHIEEGRPLPRAVQRGPATPDELADRRPRLIDTMRQVISGE